ncbi:CPBP family intramembrane glutamic endopeptidase [Staphylococcus massiliensis]|uniref:CPBP family intramembrane glutamic endopeptidase n=1 Tax=Staphylococcus massiliensis TaxID=555791 RepID=UPI001EE08F95|nr:CPBP family intramembrane glutamic endopeptidase [Staphylococcus massiliensis]
MNFKTIGFVILMFALAKIVTFVLSTLKGAVYGDSVTKNDQAILGFDYQNTSVIAMLLFVLTIGVITPILEELAFRGIFYHKIFKYGSFFLPLIIISLIFGSLHSPTDIVSLLIYFSLGVILFLAYVKTKNILTSMLVHNMNNLIPALTLFILYLNGINMSDFIK